MVSGDRQVRVGLVGIDAHFRHQLMRAATPFGFHVTDCDDIHRFTRPASVDPHWGRVLVMALDGDDVWDLLGELSATTAAVPVVALHHGDERQQLRAIEAGAAGVVSREAAPERVLRAVASVLDGDAVLSRHTLALFAALLPPSTSPLETLTVDERKWLRWLAAGESVQGVADRCGWSPRQMRRRLSGLYLRIGVTNRDQAVALASRHRVIDD